MRSAAYRFEGYTAEEWAMFARRKAAIASHVCRENGQLKSKLNAKDDSVFEGDPWHCAAMTKATQHGNCTNRKYHPNDWSK